MLKEQVMDTLNELFVKFKVPMKIKDIFLYRPTFHELPFEDFEPINDARRLAVCDPLCIEFDYEYSNYNFSYHIECTNSKGAFRVKTLMLKSADIYPKDTQKMGLKEKEITRKSQIRLFSAVLLQQLSLLARDSS
jgi:hypothetical protein